MVQNNGDLQPQGGDSNVDLLAGASNDPQLGGGTSGVPGSGADGTPSEPAPRTYSQAEWDSRGSALDKQVAEQRNTAGRIAMTLQAERAQVQENNARASDARAVEDGDITPQEAETRSRQRITDIQSNAERQRVTEGVQSMVAHGEEVARFTLAQELGREHGIPFQELLQAPNQGPDRMAMLAERLAFDKEKNQFARNNGRPETYDGGGGGGGAGSGSIESMSPTEKINYGITHPPRSRS